MAIRHVRALVVAACAQGTVAALPAADVVIAADSGTDTVHDLGGQVDIVVGDLDSVSAEALAWARSQGAQVLQHPARKDATDLELALQEAVDCATDVHVLASAGGRLDHALANLTILASQRWAQARVSATIDSAHVDVVRGLHRLGGQVGDSVSLLAIGGSALVVRTHGLEYPLTNEELSATSGRGVSNVITKVPPLVEVGTGVLLAVRPG